MYLDDSDDAQAIRLQCAIAECSEQRARAIRLHDRLVPAPDHHQVVGNNVPAARLQLLASQGQREIERVHPVRQRALQLPAVEGDLCEIPLDLR
jgi:hypothetical protein